MVQRIQVPAAKSDDWTDPWGLCGGRREPAPDSHPLTSACTGGTETFTCRHAYVQTQTHTYTHKVNSFVICNYA